MSFPRYPKYKESGVEWLGDVPEHWTVISIKWLSPVRRGASPRPIDDPKYFDDDGAFAWVRIADVSACNGILSETTQRLSELGSSLSVKIGPGELFVSIAGTVGKPCLSAIDACIHDGFVYFPMLKLDRRFLYRVFEAGSCYGGLGKWGTQLNLNTDTIGSIRIAVPPSEELQHLLAFLDRETAKIDELVAEQRRLIELLNEKRQAVISHAVTKGLNPHAPKKSSGIDWLGDVPEHWEVSSVRNLVRTERLDLQDGNHGELHPKSSDYRATGIPFVMASDLRDGTINFDACTFISEDLAKQLRIGPSLSGDVLLTNKGTLGEVAIVPREIDFPFLVLTPQVTYYRISSPTDIYREYLAFYLRSFGVQNHLALLSCHQATRPSVSLLTQRELVFALPPIDEQIEIVAQLSEECVIFDGLVTEAERVMQLLQERRTALISAAVTGKIDVRGFASSEAR